MQQPEENFEDHEALDWGDFDPLDWQPCPHTTLREVYYMIKTFGTKGFTMPVPGGEDMMILVFSPEDVEMETDVIQIGERQAPDDAAPAPKMPEFMQHFFKEKKKDDQQ